MIKAIRIEKNGGPEVLEYRDYDLPPPGPNEVRVRHTAIGVNFIDIYHRTGLYPVPLPSGIGLEAAAVVEKTGPGVTEFKVGDRVAYASAPIGAYAEWRLYPAERAVKLPEGISDRQGAAMMLQGMTVEYLIRRTFPVKAGQVVLFHAAA